MLKSLIFKLNLNVQVNFRPKILEVVIKLGILNKIEIEFWMILTMIFTAKSVLFYFKNSVDNVSKIFQTVI